VRKRKISRREKQNAEDSIFDDGVLSSRSLKFLLRASASQLDANSATLTG
jgi:hypothetical protein